MRHHSGNTPMNRNHVFDSNGPDLRVRGTAQQLFEKYLQLGRDATSGGDRVMAESYFQHAEHYFRILNAMNQAAGQPPGQPPGPNGQHRRSGGDQSSSEQDENEEQPSGLGDQPSSEPREVPIAAAPPDA